MKIRMYVIVHRYTKERLESQGMRAYTKLHPSFEEAHAEGRRIVSFEVDIPDSVFDFGDLNAEVSDVKVEE